MRRPLLTFIGWTSAIAALAVGFVVYILFESGDADYWEGDIAAFERLDVSNPPPPGAVLFVGSDVFRRWQTLTEDMAPLYVLNRAFGGARLSHVTYYADRIIHPYDPQAIVLYAGEADISSVDGTTGDEVFADFVAFVDEVREGGVGPPVYFVSIMPAPQRMDRWFEAARANDLIRDFAAATNGVYYVDVASAMFRDNGSLREDLFAWDGLTLNDDGYALWARLIRRALVREMR